MRYWDNVDSIGIVMDTFPFVLAALTSWFLWWLAALVFKIRGRWERPVVKAGTFVCFVAFLAIAESVALFVFVRIDLPLPPTVYAVDYVRSEYNEVRVGDSEEHLYELIGKPLRVSEWNEDEILFYSLADNGIMGSYWLRCVSINKSTRKVSGKVASFYTGL